LHARKGYRFYFDSFVVSKSAPFWFVHPARAAHAAILCADAEATGLLLNLFPAPAVAAFKSGSPFPPVVYPTVAVLYADMGARMKVGSAT
jgi:hypothetical protein